MPICRIPTAGPHLLVPPPRRYTEHTAGRSAASPSCAAPRRLLPPIGPPGTVPIETTSKGRQLSQRAQRPGPRPAPSWAANLLRLARASQKTISSQSVREANAEGAARLSPDPAHAQIAPAMQVSPSLVV